LALHNYHEQYGSFPPAVTYDAAGRPAHSWRVLILPFLEEKKLYDQYKFDEPWNSPHNSKLAVKIPQPYRCPSFDPFHDGGEWDSPHFKTLTNYVAIVGPDAVFGKNRATKFDDITDGTSNTLLVADTKQHAVHWMQPEDITPEEILTDLQYSKSEPHTNHVGGSHFLFADGRVTFLNADIAPETLRSLITRDGNETIPENY
jgi:prepilin-type processing-associated H-X9-DG protein